MNYYQRLIAYHAENRPSFVLFTECIGFVGAMAVISAIGFIRDWLL